MSRETTFQKKINQRWALLLREIDQDETQRFAFSPSLSACLQCGGQRWVFHSSDFKNPDNQAIFAAFTKPLLAKIGP